MRKLYKNRCGLLCILTMCLLCISCLPEDLELPYGKEVDSKTYTVNGVSFTMIGVVRGTFIMGSDSNDYAIFEDTPHQVILDSYLIGETEVTQELWKAVMGHNPSYHEGDLQLPVESISWHDCQNFISKLNELTGESFRLPTEAEWEYAARGGNIGKGYKYSGSNMIKRVAWYYENSSGKTHPVKTKQPNELGIYDMSGNVKEWCSDWLDDYPSSAQTNPTGPLSGLSRMNRGGGYGAPESSCLVTIRGGGNPEDRDEWSGLRLALQFIP